MNVHDLIEKARKLCAHEAYCSGASGFVTAAIRSFDLTPLEREYEGMVTKQKYALMGLSKAVEQLAPYFEKPITDETIPLWLTLNEAQRHAKEVLAAATKEGE